jgi:putative transposase
MDLRVQLIQDHDEGESVAGLAEMYGVARRTVYKWVQTGDIGNTLLQTAQGAFSRTSPVAGTGHPL